jgi:hypothetical protein
MKRQTEDIGFNTDIDDVKPPAFGYDFSGAPLVQIRVPDVIAREGWVYAGNHRHNVRRNGDCGYVDLRREDADELLRHPVWAALNKALA